VKGRWKYPYRAIDKHGATLDFHLADRRNTKAAKRFLAAALKRSWDWIPRVINTDKNAAYGEALAELKSEGVIPPELKHRAQASAGQVPEQPARERSRQAQTSDPTDARLPVDADGAGDDHRL
jgi:transposase-like protein